MILFPNAKINIGLYVERKRPDGYHDLSTLFYPVGWCDVLEIVPSVSGKTTLTVTGRAVECPPEKNLVMKAYNSLASRVPLPAVDIYLHKIIPDGAGLGGGSSDAAFTLRGLNQLFDLGLSDDTLARIAVWIGADCPFFIYNTPMTASGIGDILHQYPLSLDGYLIAIVKPDVSVSTKEAYSGVTPRTPKENLASCLKRPVAEWRSCIGNDFEASIFRDHPEISAVKERMYGLGAAYSSMSGSGAAVYGLFPPSFSTDILSAQLLREFSGMSVWCGESNRQLR